MHLYRTNLGDLVAASFPIPQNPILMNTAQKTGLMGFGDLVAASFPLPQNPIMAPTSMDRAKILTPGDTRNALMRSLTAQRTGPVSSTVGMGDASSVLQSTGQFLDSTIAIAGFDVPYWALAAAAGALLIFMGTGKPGKNRYQRVKAAIAPA